MGSPDKAAGSKHKKKVLSKPIESVSGLMSATSQNQPNIAMAYEFTK